MAWRHFAIVALLALPLPVAGAGPDPTYCEQNPADPRCDPAYCDGNPTDPYCSDPDHCLRVPDDPICAGWQPPLPCAWDLGGSTLLSIGQGAPGAALVTLECPAHVKLGWRCDARSEEALVSPDPTPGSVVCALLREEPGTSGPCATRWTWLAARASARLATTSLTVFATPDLDCDGRADDGAAPQATSIAWR